MKFHVLTIFPELFKANPYFERSIMKRAIEKKAVSIEAHDLRDWSVERHRKVDDTPYGGGPGMVLMVGPIHDAVKAIKKKRPNAHVVLFSTRGKKLDDVVAKRLTAHDDVIFICGRYEGVDERVADYVADEELSIGDFVLTGGELPAIVTIEAVGRFIPGVLGKTESLEAIKGSYPAYTKPEVFKTAGEVWSVPPVLLSGDHKKIEEWRRGFGGNAGEKGGSF